MGGWYEGSTLKGKRNVTFIWISYWKEHFHWFQGLCYNFDSSDAPGTETAAEEAGEVGQPDNTGILLKEAPRVPLCHFLSAHTLSHTLTLSLSLFILDGSQLYYILESWFCNFSRGLPCQHNPQKKKKIVTLVKPDGSWKTCKGN